MSSSGDRRFEQLYRAHYRKIVRFFLANFRFTDAEARELAQDVFKRVYEHMETYAADSDEAYLREVARNVALNEIRARQTAKRAGIAVSIDEAQEVAARRGSRPDDVLGRREVIERLRDGILNLPPRPRTCMMLWLEGLTYNQMAERLDVTLDAVKACLFEARKRLRAMLPDELKDELPE